MAKQTPSQPEPEPTPKPKPKRKHESKPEPQPVEAIAKKPEPTAGRQPGGTGGIDQAGLIASAKQALDGKVPGGGELERQLSKAAGASGLDLIDLDAGDLEPVAHQVKAIAGATKAKAHRIIDAKHLQGEPEASAEVGEDGATIPDQVEESADHAAAGPAIQPLGISIFERLALSTIVASENHLAELADQGDEPATKPVSTVAGEDRPEESAPPVVIEDPDVVKAEINRAPASDISPGLDEMVISSTSQTDFDLNDSEMVFSGNVQVKSPRFNLRADKFIVHLKTDRSGMSYGEAIGDVVIELREGGQPTGYTGLADHAIYHPGEGKITLSGWPKIRQQYKEHVAVTRDTKMVLYTDGRVKTLGRNRTLIRK